MGEKEVEEEEGGGVGDEGEEDGGEGDAEGAEEVAGGVAEAAVGGFGRQAFACGTRRVKPRSLHCGALRLRPR